jgi:hypothetical protein
LFDNSREFQIQMKLKLRCCIMAVVVAIGSSRQVEEGINEVIFRPIALL